MEKKHKDFVEAYIYLTDTDEEVLEAIKVLALIEIANKLPIEKN